ncbi:helix-turn-helix transcriptional regulator [Streptomyces syringium]|uniref:response regulator transcription factor n=1 Tax=Streptomyces syringium TaxID=76729 RepID=UPI0034219EFA
MSESTYLIQPCAPRRQLRRVPLAHPELAPAPPLNPLELRVLDAISRGRTNSQIGRALGRAENSVKGISHRIYVKLGAADRAHAVAIGYQTGLLGTRPLDFDDA